VTNDDPESVRPTEEDARVITNEFDDPEAKLLPSPFTPTMVKV
jgi:hypothetical protein